jgi:hypothetical protein
MDPQESAGYGHYEGTPPPYTSQPGQTYDDNFVEAVAQRFSQRISQSSGFRSSSRPDARLRLSLAIVSICMLVPLAGIFMGVLGTLGLIGFGVACVAIAIINVVFNGFSH